MKAINQILTLALLGLSTPVLAQEARNTSTKGSEIAPVTRAVAQNSIQEAPPVVPAQTYEKQSAFHGFDSLYLVQGAWSISKYSVKVDGDDWGNYSRGRYSFGFSYLREAVNDFWMGPYLAYTLESVDIDGDDESQHQWRPGLEMRKVFTTSGNGYLSLFGRFGWAFAGNSKDDSGGKISGSVNGFNYGGGLSIGNRIGEKDVYIVEAVLEFSGGKLQGDITQSSTKLDYEIKGNRFFFGLAIGKPL
jgi:hypothetical protein